MGLAGSVEEGAQLEAAAQVDRVGVEVPRQGGGGDAQGARSPEGIAGLEALRERLIAPAQIQLQPACRAAHQQIRPAIAVQVTQGGGGVVIGPDTAVCPGQSHPGSTLVLESPYPTVLVTDEQVQVAIVVQVRQEGGTVVTDVNAPEVVIGGRPGRGLGCSRVLVEVEATVLRAHQEIVVTIAVQVAKCGLGVLAHIKTLVVHRCQHPVGVRRRSQVAQEIHRPVVLADEEVQVAVGVNIH